jgi:hypothetical protein
VAPFLTAMRHPPLRRHEGSQQQSGQRGVPSRLAPASALHPVLRLQQSAGNAAVARAMTESERFRSVQQSTAYERDPDVSSMRNHIIDLYERVASVTPETYVGSIYSQALPPSTTESNYTAAATSTARDPVNNRTRWALQAALTQYALVHGYDEMVARAQSSTEFSYRIHESAFQFANDQPTIGRLPWALLTMVDVPALGESVGGIVHAPEAFLAGLEAGLTSLALDPLDSARANAAFDRAWAVVMRQRHDLGGRLINWTIETTNSPYGGPGMPWYGRGMRAVLDAASWATWFAYD